MMPYGEDDGQDIDVLKMILEHNSYVVAYGKDGYSVQLRQFRAGDVVLLVAANGVAV